MGVYNGILVANNVISILSTPEPNGLYNVELDAINAIQELEQLIRSSAKNSGKNYSGVGKSFIKGTTIFDVLLHSEDLPKSLADGPRIKERSISIRRNQCFVFYKDT